MPRLTRHKQRDGDNVEGAGGRHKGAGCQLLGDESQSRTSHWGSKGEDSLQVHRHRGKTNPCVKRDLKFGSGGAAQPPRPSMTKDERQKKDSEKLRTAVEEARPTAKMEELFKKATVKPLRVASQLPEWIEKY
jgi:hypothetical protein